MKKGQNFDFFGNSSYCIVKKINFYSYYKILFRASLAPVGQGRSEPNANPFLMPPIGRVKWSWNPITLAVNIL